MTSLIFPFLYIWKKTIHTTGRYEVIHHAFCVSDLSRADSWSYTWTQGCRVSFATYVVKTSISHWNRTPSHLHRAQTRKRSSVRSDKWETRDCENRKSHTQTWRILEKLATYVQRLRIVLGDIEITSHNRDVDDPCVTKGNSETDMQTNVSGTLHGLLRPMMFDRQRMKSILLV